SPRAATSSRRPRARGSAGPGDAALKLLRDGVSKGCKDVAQRQRDDFRKLVAELEGKGKEAVAASPRAEGVAGVPAGGPRRPAPRHRRGAPTRNKAASSAFVPLPKGTGDGPGRRGVRSRPPGRHTAGRVTGAAGGRRPAGGR